MPRARIHERREVGEGARNHDIERRRRHIILDARDDRFRVRQRQLVDGLLQKRAFLVVAVERDDAPVRLRDGERNRRHTAAAADVEHAQSGARTDGRQMRQYGERVENVVRDHSFRFADRRQVVRRIPLREQCDVSLELFLE